MRPHQLAMLITLSVIWGSAFMLTDVILEDVPPLTLVAGRLAGAALFLMAALFVTGRSFPRDAASRRAVIFLGIVNNCIPFVLLTWGIERIDSSLAAILVASMPLSTSIIAHFWIDERFTPDRIIGVLVGFGGVFVLIGGDLTDVTSSGTLGQLAVVTGAVGYSIGTVFARRYLQNADTIQTAAGQTMVGALIMIPIALVIEMPFDLTIAPASGFSWIALGIFPSGVAYLIFFRLVRQVTATQASMVSYLIPVTAVILGVLVLDETLALSSIGGFALIILGVWIVNGGSGLFSSVRERPVPTPVGIDEVP